MSRVFFVDGMVFGSLRKVCRYYDLNYNVVYSRLKRGWSIEEAVQGVRENKD